MNTTPFRHDRAAHRDERGVLSFASLFAIIGLVIGFALVANIGRTVGTKLETQNAADAAAHAAAVELARGMNAVTATNHLIGESHALVIIHHTLGGDILDNGETKEYPSELKTGLQQSFQIADIASQIAGEPRPIKQGYDLLTDEEMSPSKSGAAIYDSRVELYRQMILAYQLHAGGAGLVIASRIPFLGWLYPIGKAMITFSLIWQGKIIQEWVLLRAMEIAAIGVKSVKKGIQTGVIPNLYIHSCKVAGAVPFVPVPLPIPGDAAKKAEKAATDVGKRHDTDVSLFPGLEREKSVPLLALPVVPEPSKVNDLAKSQLVRASTPWVQWWRVSWMRFGDLFLTLSRFKCHFKKWSDEYTPELADRARRSNESTSS